MNCKVYTFVLVLLLVASRLYVQPVYSLISDCDETFNYWEPLNLLLRGFGKQTWEYSPEYSIRSWAFLLPFYGVLYPIKAFAEIQANWNFYVVRASLGLLSLVLEWKVFKEITSTMTLEIANLWLLYQIFNPGWFHASVELLPSAGAMILQLGSINYALKYLSTGSTSNFIGSVSFNFIAGILGWPFVLILNLPLCFHYLINHRLISTVRTVFDCSLIFCLISTIVIGIDSLLYGKFAPVAWNIFFYNVLNADESAGPNIFGTEPFSYYIQNLILNFPFPTLFFAIIGITHWRLWPLWGSMITWFTIFAAQPHKEERFLYPIYAYISLSAAISSYKILKFWKKHLPLAKLVKFSIISLVILQATSRIYALVNNYTAPMDVYSTLFDRETNSDDRINVCTGREWYHFPNSFYLPDSHRLKFTKSAFDGLLPGDFLEDESIFTKIRSIPEGMNNQNLFDESKLWPLEDCDYFVDVVLESVDNEDAFNPETKEQISWNKVECSKFINSEKSKILGRTFYIPKFVDHTLQKHLPKVWNKVHHSEYNEYCLYEKVAV
ncbi:Alpha-1,2-mannosyltransferase ALG9 [Nakaseomyces bracarensis]|uniref:Mannosyltransferase n=1 Tax=Nakaseomyces bracarensis TaxID=273131 RepID=A0ABR4NNE1_9SACH